MAIRLPPRSTTDGRRYFPRREANPFTTPEQSAGAPLVVQVPPALSQLVPATGAAVVTTTSVNMVLTHLAFSIPEEMTGFIELDGERVHASSDGFGETGGIPFGDTSTRQGRRVSQVRVSFTNNSTDALDAKYILHGVPT